MFKKEFLGGKQVFLLGVLWKVTEIMLNLIQRAAFSGSRVTEESYRNVMNTYPYDASLDWVDRLHLVGQLN